MNSHKFPFKSSSPIDIPQKEKANEPEHFHVGSPVSPDDLQFAAMLQQLEEYFLERENTSLYLVQEKWKKQQLHHKLKKREKNKKCSDHEPSIVNRP